MVNGFDRVHGHVQTQLSPEKTLKRGADHDRGHGPVRFLEPAELLLMVEMSGKIDPERGLYRDHGRVLVRALVQIQREPSPWLEKKDLWWCLAER